MAWFTTGRAYKGTPPPPRDAHCWELAKAPAPVAKNAWCSERACTARPPKYAGPIPDTASTKQTRSSAGISTPVHGHNVQRLVQIPNKVDQEPQKLRLHPPSKKQYMHAPQPGLGADGQPGHQVPATREEGHAGTRAVRAHLLKGSRVWGRQHGHRLVYGPHHVVVREHRCLPTHAPRTHDHAAFEARDVAIVPRRQVGVGGVRSWDNPQNTKPWLISHLLARASSDHTSANSTGPRTTGRLMKCHWLYTSTP